MTGRAPVQVAAAVATGVLLWAAFPGPDLGWLALLALVPLVLVLPRARVRRAAWLGWLAGAVFFGANLWWVHVFGYLAWGALTLLMALTLAAFFALVPPLSRLGGWRVLLLPGWWAALELVRSAFPLGGFPWSLLGVSQAAGPLLDAARVLGSYGLSAVLVAINLALAAAIEALAGRRLPRAAGPAARPSRRPRRLPRAVGWTGVALALSLLGLFAPGPPPAAGPPVRVAIVQGNTPAGPGQVSMATTVAVVARHTRLTERLGAAVRRGHAARPWLVVWGEGAIDADPFAHPALLAQVRAATRAVGAPLLAGATTDYAPNLYQTQAILFGPNGAVLDRYAKRRLVPFGEYVPGGGLMRRLVPATRQVPYDKVPGHVLRPMSLGGVPFGVLICFESVYPQDARSLVRQGARLIVVITDNASWGRSPGSAQHLAASQLGAVEEGRTYVQAAVSGISAFVTPDGAVDQPTRLFTPAVLASDVVPRTGLTFYARYGNLVEAGLLALGLVAFAAALVLWRAGRRRGRRPAGDPDRAGQPLARSGRR